jgi:hypothetical protein
MISTIAADTLEKLLKQLKHENQTMFSLKAIYDSKMTKHRNKITLLLNEFKQRILSSYNMTMKDFFADNHLQALKMELKREVIDSLLLGDSEEFELVHKKRCDGLKQYCSYKKKEMFYWTVFQKNTVCEKHTVKASAQIKV